MNEILFVTGASGSGKTTIMKRLEEQSSASLTFRYFDSIGVPSPEVMNSDFGSGEEWQRQTTEKWVKDIKENLLPASDVLLDGQMKLAFIIEACKKNNIDRFRIVLLDCIDEVRKQRLINRGHAELANDDMMNWAQYLRNEAAVIDNAKILDTSNLNIEEAVTQLKSTISS